WHRVVAARQAAGEGSVRLAADRRWRDDADASADGRADRGDGLAPHNSTGAAEPTNAGLTKHRLVFYYGLPGYGQNILLACRSPPPNCPTISSCCAPSREKVFEPFYRIESSRDPDRGGVGLGLSVTRSIIWEHGGDISLATRKGGGLIVRLELPIGAAANLVGQR